MIYLGFDDDDDDGGDGDDDDNYGGGDGERHRPRRNTYTYSSLVSRRDTIPCTCKSDVIHDDVRFVDLLPFIERTFRPGRGALDSARPARNLTKRKLQS